MKYDHLLQDGFELDPVQIEGADFILEKRYCVVADEQGVGKTLQALIPCFLYDLRTVVVCPSTIKVNWKEEIHKFSRKELNVKIIYSAKDIEGVDFEEDVIVVSYALAQKMGVLFTLFDYWIFDECHKLKTWGSGVTRFFRNLAENCKPQFMVLQSGTPVTKTPTDWLPYLYMASMSPYGGNGIPVHSKFKSVNHFDATFCKYEETPFVKKIHGKRGYHKKHNRKKIRKKYVGLREENLHRLEEVKEGKVIRRLASEVQNLPEFYFKYVQLKDSINKQLEEMYAKYEEGETYDSPALIQQKERSAYLKAKHTVSYCEEMFRQSDRKVVIFTDHPGAAQELYLLLVKKGYKCGIVTGKTSEKSRERNVDSFKQGELDYIVLTIGTSSAGHNLTIAQDVVFNDYSWRSIDIAQAVKRIHRKGQTKRCTAHVICSDASDVRIFKVVKQKENDIAQLV